MRKDSANTSSIAYLEEVDVVNEPFAFFSYDPTRLGYVCIRDHRRRTKMAHWQEDGFEISGITFTFLGADALVDFEIRAAAIIVRAWADGALFYEKGYLVRSCYGVIAEGNKLHVSRLVAPDGVMPRISVEVAR